MSDMRYLMHMDVYSQNSILGSFLLSEGIQSKEFSNQQSCPINLQCLKKSAPRKFAPGSFPTSWKDVCIMGRILDDDCKLSYIKPQTNSDGSIYARVARSEIEDNVHRWEKFFGGLCSR